MPLTEEFKAHIEDVLQRLRANPLKPTCTCHKSSVNSASLFPPEPVRSRTCPLHGVDHGE